MPSRRTGILLLVALLGPLLALVGSSPALADEVVELIETAEEAPEGTIPIIVQLDTPTRPEAQLSPVAAARQRDRIDATAAGALDDVDAGEVDTVRATETLPYVMLEATPAAIEELAQSPEVASIEPDRTMEVDSLDTSTTVVQATVASTAGFTGTGYNVAILDTGVEAAHEFFTTGSTKVSATGQACFSSGSDCPNSSTTMTGAGAGAPCTYSSDDCYHGTHVAGIAAGSRVGVGTNPTRGVAVSAGIVPVQVFSQSGTDAVAFFSDIVLGLDWVNTNRTTYSIASVNMSLGDGTNNTSACDTGSTASMKAAIDSLRAAGIATIASAGNSGFKSGIGAPACISSAISVGATDNDDNVASFSNMSTFTSLMAPGSSIRASLLSNSYGSLSGTSMAAPHVAGAWAVLRQARTAASLSADVTAELAAVRAAGQLINDQRTGGTVTGIPRLALRDALEPGPPTSIGVLAGIGQATVSWTAPTWTGAGAVTGFEVDVWATAIPGTVTTTTVVAGTTLTVISSLAVPGDHTFAVRAVNSVGAGKTSSSATVATAPAAPTNVVADRGSGRASVAWTAPSDGGSAITDYKVTVSPTTDVTAATIAVGSATTGSRFTGLTNGSTYTFTVTAVNAVGESVASAASNEVTPRSSSSGGGGGGGGGGGSGTTTTTRPRTTTTTAPPDPEPVPVPEPDPVASPGASVGNGNVVTIRDGEAVVIPRSAPAGANVVGGAVTPSGDGAWSVTSTGEVFVAGDARDLGDLTGFPLNAPIVGIASTPSGNGYWLLGRDGGIFSFGNAPFFGSTGGTVLNQPVVGMAASESGNGYWLFAGDGGIFTFGDSRFFGSTGALRLNAPVTTMAPTPSGRGYWLLGADGGVFTFGDASFHGSTGGRADVGAIEAIVPSDTGKGYWLIGNDSRLHTFGDAASLAGTAMA